MTAGGDVSGRLRPPLVWLTLLALCSRALWLFRPAWESGDSPEYLRIAASLVTHHLFSDDGRTPSSYRPPLYPAIIAAADLLTNHPIATILVLQVILGALTASLTYAIAEELFGRTTAWLSGLIVALAPMSSRYTTVVLTETIFTFLIVWSVWAWVRGTTVSSGLRLGLAALMRASSLPYAILLAVYGLVGPRGTARQQALTVALTALLTVTPWGLRNVVQVHRLTLADAGWGVNLLFGTVDLQPGSNRWSQLLAVYPGVTDGTQRETPHSDSPGSNGGEAEAAKLAMSWIRQHPASWLRIRMRQWPWLILDTGDYLPVSANRLSFSEARATHQVSTIALKAIFTLGNAVLLAFAILGTWSLRGRVQQTIPLWSFPVYLMLAHVHVYVEPRYGIPLVPFLVIFAAEGARISSRRWGQYVQRGGSPGPAPLVSTS